MKWIHMTMYGYMDIRTCSYWMSSPVRTNWYPVNTFNPVWVWFLLFPSYITAPFIRSLYNVRMPFGPFGRGQARSKDLPATCMAWGGWTPSGAVERSMSNNETMQMIYFTQVNKVLMWKTVVYISIAPIISIQYCYLLMLPTFILYWCL